MYEISQNVSMKFLKYGVKFNRIDLKTYRGKDN